MSSPNTQMFALREPPPRRVEVAGGAYEPVRVFKHDFFAATCLYAGVGEAQPERIVVKLYRTQPFLGLAMAWASFWRLGPITQKTLFVRMFSPRSR